MDTSQINQPDFWRDDCSLALANPRDHQQAREVGSLTDWLNTNLPAHLAFSTSGSTGAGKWVALSKFAMMHSAQAVNQHLQVGARDQWLLALPTFHVGGASVIARAILADIPYCSFDEKWNPFEFVRMLRRGATLTSLVPTQLRDIVVAQLPAPPELRAVLIGGGALRDDLYEQAMELNWPVVETYGMTETCSQVATASVGERVMKRLPIWQVKCEDGILHLKGEALLSGYLENLSGSWSFCEFPRDSWFRTSDRVTIDGDQLVPRGRADRCVKVLGELVDLDAIDCPESCYIIAVPDDRLGSSLILCTDGNLAEAEAWLAMHHAKCSPLERIQKVFPAEILRSPLGKVKVLELTKHVAGRLLGDQ